MLWPVLCINHRPRQASKRRLEIVISMRSSEEVPYPAPHALCIEFHISRLKSHPCRPA
ncbi:hypothetical protein BDW75DRAFT_220734 [Aspergillus navahoensis]